MARRQEVERLLLTNYTRIKEGKPGNLVFAVHRSSDDPDAVWLCET